MKSDFEKKLEMFQWVIKFASRRFEIPGELDRSDLVQEGMLVLNDCVQEYEVEVVDELSFQKLFKTRLYHRMSDLIRACKAQCRDFRVSDSVDWSGTPESMEGEGSLALCEKIEGHVLDPSDYDGEHDMEVFLNALSEKLDFFQSRILFVLLNPPAQSDMPEHLQQSTLKKELSVYTMASILGAPYSDVKRELRHLRAKASEVAHELGIMENGFFA